MSNAISTLLRAAVAAACFAVAGVMLVRSWHPLGYGYFRPDSDSPDGLYLTMAAIGASLAAIFLTTGLLLLSRRFRTYGGFVLLACAALAASVLPFLLFKWTSRPDTWPWAYLIEYEIGWLHFEPQPRSDGITIQVLLAALVVAALAAQIAVWRRARLRATASAVPA